MAAGHSVVLARWVPGLAAKGRRFCGWVVIDLAGPRPGGRRLLIRRNRSVGELACHRCASWS
ncbi:hypothetical protein ACGF8D_08815 [Streptomyces massasporeus]|uniref:hypothetical protein n=1 Tax=Streptomyces massasporeus TaxID=67324 RepID=UPI00371B691B